MTLPSSGPITIGQVAGELGISLPLSLGDSRVLALAGKSAPPISLSDLYGKSAQAPLSVTAQDGYDSFTSVTSGTASAAANAYPAGGSGGYTYAWSLVSSSNNPTIGALNGPSVSISKAYVKNATGAASATFNLTVTDSQGHTATVNGVHVTVEWYSNQ